MTSSERCWLDTNVVIGTNIHKHMLTLINVGIGISLGYDDSEKPQKNFLRIQKISEGTKLLGLSIQSEAQYGTDRL